MAKPEIADTHVARTAKPQDVPIHICIGAARAGTTWLFNNLAELENVFVPCVKEVRYWCGRRSPEEIRNTVQNVSNENISIEQRAWLDKWMGINDFNAANYIDLMSFGKL